MQKYKKYMMIQEDSKCVNPKPKHLKVYAIIFVIVIPNFMIQKNYLIPLSYTKDSLVNK